MNKLWKISGGLAVIAAALLVGLVVLVKLFVTPERIKAIVLPLAEQKLHRQISLGEVKVGLFSGIELNQLAVREPGEREPFVAADRAVLRFQLLPLLGRRVVIDEVSLERPLIRIIRRADGSLNISDLPPSQSGAKPADAAKVPVAGDDSQPLSVLVTVVQVRDGRLAFIDRQVAATTELTELQLEASGITLDGTIPVKLSANVQGAPLKMEGVARPLQRGGTFKVDLQGLDALRFEPYFRGKVPGKLSRLLLDLTGGFDVRGKSVAAKGTVAGRDLDLLLLPLPTAPLQKARLSADYDVSLDLERDRLDLRSLTITFNDLAAQFSGAVVDLTKAPAADLALNLPPVELSRLKSALPAGLLGKAAELELAGTLQASARLHGSFDRPLRMLRSAEVVFGRVQVSTGGQRPVLDGRLKLAGDQLVSEALTVSLGDNKAELKMIVRSLFDKPLIVSADLTAVRFPVEALLGGAAAPAAAAGGPAGGGAKAYREVGPFDLPLQAAGTIRIGEGGWRGLTVKNFITDYALKDNQLTVGRMSGSLGGGSFNNTAHVDLRRAGLGYDAKIDLQGVDMQSLLPALAPEAAGALYGKLAMQGTLTGSGTRWANLSRTLSGDMAMVLTDGRVTSPALVKGLAAFLQLPDLNEIAFSDFRGEARIAGGKAAIDSVIQSRQLKLFPRGTVGLDGSLNLAMDTRLSPELTARIDQRGKVTRYLLDADGWSQVLLQVGGTLQAPRYGLDPKGVQAQAGKVLQNELQRGLEKLLKKSQPPPASPAPPESAQEPAQQQAAPLPPASAPAQKLLEESLKKVLRR